MQSADCKGWLQYRGYSGMGAKPGDSVIARSLRRGNPDVNLSIGAKKDWIASLRLAMTRALGDCVL